MTVQEVRLIFDQFGHDSEGRPRAKQRYYVKADTFISCDQGLTASDGTTAVAVKGQSYSPTRLSTRAVDVVCDRITYNQLQVEVDYLDPSLGLFPPDLLALPARITEDDEEFMEEYYRDEADPQEFVVNAAGEPFDKGPQRLAGIVVYTVRKYVNAATRNNIRMARRTNNASPKTIDGFLHDTDTLLLAKCTFTTIEGVSGVYDAAMLIKYNADRWRDLALDVGFSELVGGQRRKITEQLKVKDDPLTYENVPVARPWPLLASGAKKPTPDAKPDVLEFWPYKNHPWTGVPLA